ncbi:MAG: hypothetical protein ABW188_16730, partial [Rhodococcus fascians]
FVGTSGFWGSPLQALMIAEPSPDPPLLVESPDEHAVTSAADTTTATAAVAMRVLRKTNPLFGRSRVRRDLLPTGVTPTGFCGATAGHIL